MVRGDERVKEGVAVGMEKEKVQELLKRQINQNLMTTRCTCQNKRQSLNRHNK